MVQTYSFTPLIPMTYPLQSRMLLEWYYQQGNKTEKVALWLFQRLHARDWYLRISSYAIYDFFYIRQNITCFKNKTYSTLFQHSLSCGHPLIWQLHYKSIHQIILWWWHKLVHSQIEVISHSLALPQQAEVLPTVKSFCHDLMGISYIIRNQIGEFFWPHKFD